MVLEAPNPYLPEAVCWSVEVVKGARGLRLKTLLVTSLIVYFLFLISSLASFIESLFLKVNLSTLLFLKILILELIKLNWNQILYTI